jgi:subtilisin
MAKTKPHPEETARGADAETAPVPTATAELLERARRTGTTGRMVMVVQAKGGAKAAVAALQDKAGVATVSTADTGGAALSHEDLREKGVLFHDLGILVAPLAADQARHVRAAAADAGVAYSRPERIIRLPGPLAGPMAASAEGFAPGPIAIPAVPGVPIEYLLGYRDGVLRLIEGFLAGLGVAVPVAPTVGFSFPGVIGMPPGAAPSSAPTTFANTASLTWGLQATMVAGEGFSSQFTGQGVRVAILDTGMDLNHPDFQDGRIADSKSFNGLPVQDRHGHGTHVAGTAAGPESSTGGRRYSVAPGAELYVAKLLSDPDQSGLEFDAFGAIAWAISNNCRVANMSFEVENSGGQPDPVWDTLSEKALTNNLLLVAAAGNHRQQGNTVNQPANSKGVMAVAAVDRFLHLAPFSNPSGAFAGAGVDLAAPGVDVYSSWSQTSVASQLEPGLPPAGSFGTISGTSQATPHVAGIAALIAEARPDLDAKGIWLALLQLCRTLPLSPRDVGKGLARAPRDD